MTATNAKTTTATPVPDLAQKAAGKLVSTVKKGQQLTVDAATVWAKAVSVLPKRDLPKIPGLPAAPSTETITTFSFDLAAELLQAQKEFALNLANAVAPAKSA